MPIPILFIGIAAGAAALGIGKSIKAGIDHKDANETNECARSIAEKATETANQERKASGNTAN